MPRHRAVEQRNPKKSEGAPERRVCGDHEGPMKPPD